MSDDLKAQQAAEQRNVERLAASVVRLTENFVSKLQLVHEFAPKTLKNRQDSGSVAEVKLYTHVFSLVSRIQSIHNIILLQVPISEQLWPKDLVMTEAVENQEGERWNLVTQVLWPIVDSLGRCYAYLDRIPMPTATEGTKPPPPIGMLSIQNYTDIACLLEFLVSTSIMPLLEPHILPTIQDRSHYFLPKSLAGRLSPKSLLWGCSQRILVEHKINELDHTSKLVGYLVLLDRFRPMLLPRHLADIYAAILTVQASQHSTNLPLLDTQLSSSVDSVLRAQAYQTLLLHGTRTPLWLRLAVSDRLTEMATHDLASIVEVFIHSVQRDITVTSVRLAQALLVTHSKDQAFVDALLRQLCGLLDKVAKNGEISIETLHASGLDSRQKANICLIWAVIAQLPDCMVEAFWSLELKKSLASAKKKASTDIHLLVRRLGLLLLAIPTSMNPSAFCKLLLSVLNDDQDNERFQRMSIFEVLVREASLPAVLHSKLKEDAICVVRLLVGIMVPEKFEMEAIIINGVDLFCLAIVHALAPLEWDINGFQFYSFPDDSKALEESGIQCGSSGMDGEMLIKTLESRARFLVRELLLPLCSVEEQKDDDSDILLRSIPSNIFRLLLSIYLSIGLDETEPNEMASCMDSGPFQMVALFSLPMMGEKIPPSSLLLEGDDASAIFETMGIVFTCTAQYLSSEEKVLDLVSVTENARCSISSISQFRNAEMFFIQVLRLSKTDSPMIRYPALLENQGDIEIVFSICSILLHILVGILELGHEKRTSSDEAKLVSLTPVLDQLASCTTISSEDDSIKAIISEIADIASHALALIASREALSAEYGSKIDVADSNDPISRKLREAESDLRSNLPAVRARGVVSLRHAVTAINQEDASSRKKGYIEVVESCMEDHLERALSIAVGALMDKESYVYLAAIQTIATIADQRPPEIVSIVSAALANGYLNTAISPPELLSAEQRVKLAEALIFILRRRASVFEYLQPMIDILVYGSAVESPVKVSPEHSSMMQMATHEYFRKDLLDEFPVTEEERWDGVDTRVKTGGPIFSEEEDHLVAASKISCLAELASIGGPEFCSNYCSSLIDCAVSALRHNSSRLIRRAGAYLARDLYRCMIHEQDDSHDSMPSSRSFPHKMAIAMVSYHEERLAATLERCLNGNDLSDFEGSTLVCDPATIARCEEAIFARQMLEDGGVLAAARLAQREISDTEKTILAMLEGE